MTTTLEENTNKTLKQISDLEKELIQKVYGHNPNQAKEVLKTLLDW